MKYLVTGATGFIGSHLVEALVNRGEDVRVLIRPTSDRSRLPENVEIAYGDICDLEAVRRAVQGVEVVFHLAAIMRDWGPRGLFERVNVCGTEQVVRACLESGVKRLIYTSSIAATGLEDYPGLKDETFPYTQSEHPYCATKAQAEQLVLRAHREQGLPAVVLRPTYVYGPRERNVGPYIIARLLKRGFRILPGDGSNYHHMVYVGDLVEALQLAATVPGIEGQVYLIGGPLHTARETWDALARAMGAKPIIYVPLWVGYLVAWVLESTYRLFRIQHPPLLTFFRLGVIVNNNAWDISKAQRELGFVPRVDLDEGMRAAVAWWRQHGYL